jgi:hypothetical protein
MGAGAVRHPARKGAGTSSRPTLLDPLQLQGFRASLESGTAGQAVLDTLDAAGALLLLPDADCSLGFWEYEPRDQSMVRWRLTIREPAPGLGTWWTSGELCVAGNDWVALGSAVARLLSRGVPEHRVRVRRGSRVAC